MLLMSRCMPNCRGGSRRQLALEECKLFGESNMANIDCGLSVVDCWKFGGLPGSIHRPYQPFLLKRKEFFHPLAPYTWYVPHALASGCKSGGNCGPTS